MGMNNNKSLDFKFFLSTQGKKTDTICHRAIVTIGGLLDQQTLDEWCEDERARIDRWLDQGRILNLTLNLYRVEATVKQIKPIVCSNDSPIDKESWRLPE